MNTQNTTKLQTELYQIVQTAYAGGYTDDDVREECKRLNKMFNISNAYEQARNMYSRQFKTRD